MTNNQELSVNIVCNHCQSPNYLELGKMNSTVTNQLKSSAYGFMAVMGDVDLCGVTI